MLHEAINPRMGGFFGVALHEHEHATIPTEGAIDCGIGAGIGDRQRCGDMREHRRLGHEHDGQGNGGAKRGLYRGQVAWGTTTTRTPLHQ